MGASARTLSCGDELVLELKSGQTVTTALLVQAAGNLRLSELGADVQVATGSDTPKELVYPMTRYAWRRVPVAAGESLSLSARLSTAEHGRLRVDLDCKVTDPDRQAWQARAEALAWLVDINTMGSPDAEPFLALQANAATDAERAGALHMLALVYYRSLHYDQSAATYAQAARTWRATGNRIGQAGALIGQAAASKAAGVYGPVEGLMRQAQALLDPKADGYFLARTMELRCWELERSHQTDAALACHQQAIAAFRSAGDLSDALNALINLTWAFRDSGKGADLEAKLAAVMRDSSRGLPMTLGRAYLARAYLARDRGDVVAALGFANQSLRQFELATDDSVAWQAATLLYTASLYATLGISDQAYRLITQSLDIYPPRSAPARVAAALINLANIERSTGRDAQAAAWFERAERIYGLIGQPTARAEAQLGMLESSVPEDPASARELLAQTHDWKALSDAHAGRLALLQVRWLLGAGETRQAGTELNRMLDGRHGLPLPQRLQATALRADILDRSGESTQALALIQQQMLALVQLVEGKANGALSYLTLRTARDLRAAWVRIALKLGDQVPMADWWQVLARSAPLQAVRPGQSDRQRSDLGAALASELLGDGTLRTDRALIANLGQREAEAVASRAAVASLAQVQATLGDASLLVIVPAEPQSAALWINAERAVVVPVPGRAALREQIRALINDLSSANVPVTRLDASVRALSASMFAGAPDARPPPHLLLLSDDLIGTVPLALLHWPGSDDPLVDTTATGWVTRVDPDSGQADSGPKHLNAVVAPGNAATEKVGLSPLRYADAEPDLIARTLPDLPLQKHTGAAATPAALMAALDDADAWVHLAAHGYARPELLGYAGAWLASPDDSQRSVMLSWLEIINVPLHAPLAVLNACQLAAGPGATSQSSLSFASAVSAAGVDNVVAAFWPISDSASAVWIPAFYAAMRDQPAARSVDALRQAQLAMKQSRAFRHPYYWASLTYFRRLQIGPAH